MCDIVAHGRRKGSVKSAPQSHELAQGGPENVRLGRVQVLSREDWNRINYALNKRQIEEERVRQARLEREQLRDRSQNLVKNWTDTVQGARLKKLEDRRKRFEREEEERKAIDLEEAKYQAERRREAIEKAKTKQYYQTDRVKGFHSALLFTEVLKEREAQLELKRLKEQAADGKDREMHEKWEKEFEESLRIDQEKAAQKIRNARDTASFQKTQINEHTKLRQKELEDDQQEGENLRRLAVAHAMEKQRLEQIAQEERRVMMQDNLRQIADVRKMKDVQSLQEEAEMEDCRIFAAGKRKMLKLRAQREKELYEEKQKNLDRIREKLSAQLKALKDDEEDRLAKAVQEREEKLNNEEADKERQAREMQQSIAKHRADVFKRKEEEAKTKRLQELEMTRLRKEADELFRKNEAQRLKELHDRTKEVSDYRVRQTDARRAAEVKEKENQLRYDAANVHLLELEENQFQEYAKQVIDHCEKGGRNTYALRKAAKAGAGGGLGPQFPGKGGIRPSYLTADLQGVQLPTYKRDETEAVKETINGDGNTHKRMGFVW